MYMRSVTDIQWDQLETRRPSVLVRQLPLGSPYKTRIRSFSEYHQDQIRVESGYILTER